MVMGWIWCVILLFSLISSLLSGNSGLSSAVTQGAQAGLQLAISIGGSICLWSGIGKLLDAGGLTGFLCRLISPVLYRLFPSSRLDEDLRHALSGNISANILGLGNAATPMGIRAIHRMALQSPQGAASGEMCRLIVLNTASIQLIPANVAAIRAAAGSPAPFDILPAVWLSSLTSAGLGLCAAFLLERIWHDS